MVNPAQFVAQVRSEAAKVVWPSRREAGLTTMMVVLMATLCAIVFFFIDIFLRLFTDLLLSL